MKNILHNRNPDPIYFLKVFVLKRINQSVKNCLFTNTSSKNYLFDVYVHKQSEVVDDLEFPRRFFDNTNVNNNNNNNNNFIYFSMLQ